MTGDRFRAERTKLGLSYSQMAERLGVFSTTIRAWEKRKVVRPIAFYALQGMIAIESHPRLKAIVSKREILTKEIDAERERIEGMKSLRFSAKTMKGRGKVRDEIDKLQELLLEHQALLEELIDQEAEIRASVRADSGL